MTRAIPHSVPLPIIPEPLLRRHHAFERGDTRFRAVARLMQSLWRSSQELAPGTHRTRVGGKRRLGSRLTQSDADRGRNFMTPEIARLARRELIYREPRALIDENRLFSNLLSSQPLAFNLFGPLRLRNKLALSVMRTLVPDADIKRVTNILFEHSPARRDAAFMLDRTALDVAVYFERNDGEIGLIGIEIKYSEGAESTGYADDDRYNGLAHESGLFKDPSSAILRSGALKQLFREHLLCQAPVMRGDIAEARFILIAPQHNHPVARTAETYAGHLNEPLAGQAPFAFITLERVIEAYARARETDYANRLFDRYVRWDHVDLAVELALREADETWEPIPAHHTGPVALLAKAA